MTSGDDWYGGYTVETETNGVSVAVGIDLDSLPLPAIKFRVRSRRDERVGVVVRHAVPSRPGVDAVAFHPAFGADDWTAYEAGRVAWAGTLAPGETVTTLFGVWLTEPREVFAFLEAPTVGRVDPVAEHEGYDPVDPGTANKRLIDDSLAETGPASMAEMVEGVREMLSPDDGTANSPDATTETDSGGAETSPAAADAAATAETDAGDSTDEDPAVAMPADDPDPGPNSDAGPDPVAVAAVGSDDASPDAGVARAGAAALSPPDPHEVAALDDAPPTRGNSLFVRALVTGGTTDAPALLQDLVTAMQVRGRRVVSQDGQVRVDAVVAGDHGPRGLADALADRDPVADVLVEPVDRSANDPGADTTEFDVLQRNVDRVSPAEIESELDGGAGHGPGPSVAELVADTRTDAGADDHSERPSDEMVQTLVDELQRLRGRVDDLESEVSELRVRNSRLEELYQRQRERERERQRPETPTG
jgi:hypothetical protein